MCIGRREKYSLEAIGVGLVMLREAVRDLEVLENGHNASGPAYTLGSIVSFVSIWSCLLE